MNRITREEDHGGEIDHAMASRPSRAAALLLILLLFILAITTIGRVTSIFAAFDFLGAGAGRASNAGSSSSEVPPSVVYVEKPRTSSWQKNERGGDNHASSSKTSPAVKKKKSGSFHPSPAAKKDTKGKSEPMSEPDMAKPRPTKTEALAIGKPKSSKPKLAWLMSFPNSGTSYTSKLIRTITNASTATNYGASTRDEYGCSRPIASNLKNTGPFWQSNTYKHLGGNADGEYLLTKTHCGGYCNGCGPSQYFETAQSFAEACSTGKMSARCRTDNEAKSDKDEKRFVVVQYDGSAMVERAVHLLRNPFDNVVSRFHLKAKELDSRRNNKSNGVSEDSMHFDYTKEGFREWCKHIDASFVEEESGLTAFTKRKELLKKIPCHADFIRYLLWHHYAERTQANLMLPTLILHYEDYFSNFNETVAELMTFLNIERIRNEPALFESGKTYRDYFTIFEKKALKDLARSISTNETWGRIERYFSSS